MKHILLSYSEIPSSQLDPYRDKNFIPTKLYKNILVSSYIIVQSIKYNIGIHRDG